MERLSCYLYKGQAEHEITLSTKVDPSTASLDYQPAALVQGEIISPFRVRFWRLDTDRKSLERVIKINFTVEDVSEHRIAAQRTTITDEQQVHRKEEAAQQQTEKNSTPKAHEHEYNKVDRFLSYAKNHPIFSVLIIGSVIVVGLANFTDAISRLTDSIPPWFRNTTDGQTVAKGLQLELRVQNPTSAEEEIGPLADLNLTESRGLAISQYPRHRIEIRPIDGITGYNMGPRATRRFLAAISPDASIMNLLNRGAANAHFVLFLRDGGFLIESAPFVASTFEDKYLEFTTARIYGRDFADTLPQEMQSLSVTLVDGARISLTPSIQFEIKPENAPTIVATVGDDAAVQAYINEALKKHTLRALADFTLQHLLLNRPEAEDKIAYSISQEIGPRGISVLDVSLGEIEEVANE